MGISYKSGSIGSVLAALVGQNLSVSRLTVTTGISAISFPEANAQARITWDAAASYLARSAATGDLQYVGGGFSTNAASGANALTMLTGARVFFGANYLSEGGGVLQWSGNNGISATLLSASSQTGVSLTFAGECAIYASNANGKISITSNVSAGNCGATPTSAHASVYPQNALDGTDWVFNVGTASNAASLFNVAYNGTITATNLALNGFAVSSGGMTVGQITNSGLIVSTSSAVQELTGQVSDGAAAVAVAISPFGTFSNATAKIVSFRNARAGTEKLAIDAFGKLIYPTGTADAVAGNAVLVGGTVTVSTTSVKAGSVIMLTRKVVGGTTGDLRVGTITGSTSFVINSASGTDTSTVSWFIIN